MLHHNVLPFRRVTGGHLATAQSALCRASRGKKSSTTEGTDY